MQTSDLRCARYGVRMTSTRDGSMRATTVATAEMTPVAAATTAAERATRSGEGHSWRWI